MRSASERTLRGRVAWIAGLTAVASALATALLVGALSWNLALRQEDRRVEDLLRNLAFDLDHADASPETVRRLTDDEQLEVTHTGVRLSVFRGQTLVAGRAGVEPVEGCRTTSQRTLERQCGVRAGANLLVARATLTALDGYRRSFGAAVAAALALVVLAALWASRRAAAVAIGPLEALRDAVSKVRVAEPEAGALAEAQAYAELEALRAALVALIANLRTSLSQARRFAFNAAHELRTPLAALRAGVELRRESSPDPSNAQMQSLARDLSDRLDRVLVLANNDVLESGEAVALESVTHDVQRALGPNEAARVELATDEEGLVRGDPLLLQMLVRNAVENALKFSAGPVRVELSHEGETVTLAVRDRGPGIADEDRARVFEPFYRGAAARRELAPGSGLGLALIAHIASMHRGRARFEPVAEGARLVVSFPAWRGEGASSSTA